MVLLLYYIFECFFNISLKKKDVGYMLVYFTSSYVQFGIFLSKWIINMPGMETTSAPACRLFSQNFI